MSAGVRRPLLSVVIPAHNEEGSIERTLRATSEALRADEIPHELLVIDDGSTDGTVEVMARLQPELGELRWVRNEPPHGFGYAVRCGLDEYRGDLVAIVMADLSDQPEDLVLYYRTLVAAGVDCVFGSRFVRGSEVSGYPRHKLVLNRLANLFIRLVFGLPLNDTTNAFKLYRREVIDGLRPLLSAHFNLTVELPLKAIVRGFSYRIVPIKWRGRTEGTSKLKIKEMGSRYLFIVLYCLCERWLSRGDYHRRSHPEGAPLRWGPSTSSEASRLPEG